MGPFYENKMFNTLHVSSLLTQQAKPGNGFDAPGHHHKGQ